MSANPRLIFDIGLHKGEDTDFYLRKGFDVVAFEADPALVAHCRTRFAAAIADGRLTLVEGAIAPRAAGDRITFFRSSLSVWGTISPDWVTRNDGAGATSEAITVDRIDMDEAFARHGVPFYLKIDVEGADRLVLEALLRQPCRPRFLSIESAMTSFAEIEDEFDLFARLGYGGFRLEQQQNIPGRVLRTTDVAGRAFEHRFAEHASGPFGDDLEGAWLGKAEALRAYRGVFTRYRLLGNESALRRLAGRRALNAVSRLIGRPLPGWYDTHARL